jgi:hypothetical protein
MKMISRKITVRKKRVFFIKKRVFFIKKRVIFIKKIFLEEEYLLHLDREQESEIRLNIEPPGAGVGSINNNESVLLNENANDNNLVNRINQQIVKKFGKLSDSELSPEQMSKNNRKSNK